MGDKKYKKNVIGTIGLLVSIVLIVFLVNFCFEIKRGKDIRHIYMGVVLDKNTMEIVDTVEITINGKYKEPFPLLNKNYEFTGLFKIDNNAESYNDTQGYFDFYNNFFFGSLIYLVQNEKTDMVESHFTPLICTESMKMNSIVMFPSYSDENSIDDIYIIAPAQNLEEALEVYKKVMGENLNITF